MKPVAALSRARFDPGRMSKVTLAEGDRMLVGLNCLLPGQAHESHRHPGQDKLYLVLEGRGHFEIEGAVEELGPGELVLVPGGAAHGVRNEGPDKLVILVVLGRQGGRPQADE